MMPGAIFVFVIVLNIVYYDPIIGSPWIQKAVMTFSQIWIGYIAGHNYGSLLITNLNPKSWK